MTVESLLTASDDLRVAARELGRLCLEQEQEIQRARAGDDPWRADIARVEKAVAAIPEELWVQIIAGRQPVAAIWSAPAVAAAVRLLETASPSLSLLAMLRALTRSGLSRWFARTTERIHLRMGDPIPDTERDLRARFPQATPRVPTSGVRHLLEHTGFRLFDRRDGAGTGAELDYSLREMLEPVLWVEDDEDDGPRLPYVATIHPDESFTQDTTFDEDRQAGWFFNVRPKAFDLDWVLDRLRDYADLAEIAILPELSLPEPYVLADALAEAPEDFPALVVAGSAHVTASDNGQVVRSNVSAVYLEGLPLLEHRKIHPLIFSASQGVRLEERLTREPKVIRCACTSTTSLAVVICADLIDDVIPGLLKLIGVNLLAVPALTPHEGGFGEAVSGLASSRQGVSVVVNGAPPLVGKDVGSTPFMIMTGVPNHRPGEQSRSFGPPPYGRRTTGWVDPNRPLSQADPWRSPTELRSDRDRLQG